MDFISDAYRDHGILSSWLKIMQLVHTTYHMLLAAGAAAVKQHSLVRQRLNLPTGFPIMLRLWVEFICMHMGQITMYQCSTTGQYNGRGFHNTVTAL